MCIHDHDDDYCKMFKENLKLRRSCVIDSLYKPKIKNKLAFILETVLKQSSNSEHILTRPL